MSKSESGGRRDRTPGSGRRFSYRDIGRRLVHSNWRMAGPTGVVMQCDLYEDADGLELCVTVEGQPARSQRVTSIAQGQQLARVWRTALMAQDF